MLRLLRIENFAIMDKLEIEFKPGLNVLTGETGAGKSIIVDAISMLLGERASTHKVRTGHDKAVIEGLFELDASDSALRVRLNDMGIDCEGDELILRRDIFASGTGRCYVNGRLNSSSNLIGIREYLCDIHGQHQHQALLRSTRQLDLLDGFADALEIRDRVGKLFRERMELERKLEALSRGRESRKRRIDDLRYAVDEIDRADIKPGEDSELDREIEVMRHYQHLHELFGRLIDRLYEGNGSVIEALGISLKDLDDAVRIDSSLSEEANQARTCYFQLEEVGRSLRAYQAGMRFDPNRLERDLERRDLIRRLKSKYGNSVGEITAYRQKAIEDLEAIDGGEKRSEEFETRLAEVEGKLTRSAEKLTRRRREGASRLQTAVMKGIRELGMDKAIFRIRIESMADSGIDSLGAERVAFLIATNPGEAEKPLADVVSGGELSRIMLALRALQADRGHAATLVFDEVDAGIGGQVAHAVAASLLEVARDRQVFVITHLPQIAARAHHHLAVEKKAEGRRVKVEIRELDDDGRVSEIIRMLGGDDGSDASRRHASELLGMSG